MNTGAEGRLPYERHPLIVNIKACVPHLVESGAFAALVLSLEDYRDTHELCAAHLFGRFLPGRGAEDARIGFDALMARLATEDMQPEIFPTYTSREAQHPYLEDMQLLLAWQDDQGVELTFHFMETLYEVA